MKNMTLEHIAAVCGGTYIGNEADKKREIKGAVIDSRLVEKDYLFIPVRGEKVDGHSFIPSVFEKGALAVLSEEKLEDPAGPCILVENTLDAMKKIAAPIRVELAQYRELAAFAQFGSELDADTTEKLAQGERIREILKQPQYQPMPVEKQVMIIYAATKKYLIDIPVEKILDFEKALFEYVDTKYPEVPEAIRTEKVISDETEAKLVKAIEECKADFLK